MANKKEISVELKKASEPLAKFLEKYYNPMATAVVTVCDVTILSGEIKVHINESYDNRERCYE